MLKSRCFLLLFVCSLVVCASSKEAKAQDHVVKVGLVKMKPPYLVVDNEGYGGFFVDVIKMVMEQTHDKAVYVTGTKQQLVMMLKRDEVDLIVGWSMEDSHSQILRSLPFTVGHQQKASVGYGMAVAVEHQDLFYRVNHALAVLVDNGEMERCEQKWLGRKQMGRPHELMERYLSVIVRVLIVTGVILAVAGVALLLLYKMEKRKRRYVVNLLNTLPLPLAVVKKDRGMITHYFENEYIHRSNYKIRRFTTIEKNKEFVNNFMVAYEMAQKTNQMMSFEDFRLEDNPYTVYVNTCLFHNEVAAVETIYDMKEELRLKQEAVDNDKAMDAFIASISHEVRTPLNSILGFSQLLPQLPKEERGELMEVIDEKSNLLNKLINDILLLSKMQNGAVQLVHEKVDVPELLQEVIDSTKNVMNHDEAKVAVACDLQRVQVTMHTDRQLLMTLLSNAVHNALKFTRAGEVRVGGFMDEEDLILYVKDTGIGTDKEQVVDIFTPFMKVDTFTQGTGLGMPLMLEVTRLLNGRIGVYSLLDEGSTFYFRLQTCDELVLPSLEGDAMVCEQMKEAVWMD